MNRMGIVASNPQTRGKAKSAIRPRTINSIQKIFFCTSVPLRCGDGQHSGSANAVVLQRL